MWWPPAEQCRHRRAAVIRADGFAGARPVAVSLRSSRWAGSRLAEPRFAVSRLAAPWLAVSPAAATASAEAIVAASAGALRAAERQTAVRSRRADTAADSPCFGERTAGLQRRSRDPSAERRAELESK